MTVIIELGTSGNEVTGTNTTVDGTNAVTELGVLTITVDGIETVDGN